MEGRQQNANLELTEREMLDKLAQTWEAMSTMQRVAYNGFSEIKPFLAGMQGTPCFDPEARQFANLALAYASDNEFAARYVSERLWQQLRGRDWKPSADLMTATDKSGQVHDISYLSLELENLTAQMKLYFARALDIAKHNLERTFTTRLGQSRPAIPPLTRTPEGVMVHAQNKG